MPTLETPAGKPLDVTPAGKPLDVTPADAGQVNAEFRAAMDDYLPDEQAPPKRAAKPPAERAEKSRTAQRAEKSRTTAKAAAPVKDDYTADAQGLVGSVWTVTASIPYTQAYALVIEANSDALAGALAEGAKHNATIRSWMSAGSSTWMLQLASVGLSMSLQTLSLLKSPELREQAAATTREHLAAVMAAKGIEVPSREPADA